MGSADSVPEPVLMDNEDNHRDSPVVIFMDISCFL